jgi:hypothetical protein
MDTDKVWAIIKGKRIVGMEIDPNTHSTNWIALELEDGSKLRIVIEGQYDERYLFISATDPNASPNVKYHL